VGAAGAGDGGDGGLRGGGAGATPLKHLCRLILTPNGAVLQSAVDQCAHCRQKGGDQPAHGIRDSDGG
jgi:hypothetical protein